MTGSDLSWRLRVDSAAGEPLGGGFIVRPDTGLTCAHLVTGGSTFRVGPLGGRVFWDCPISPADPGWDPSTHRWPDVAVIRLPGTRRGPAPLGPAARPASGTIVDVLGFPAGFEDEGQRTRARVLGEDASGAWLQLDGLHGHDGRIAPGFSGSAAVDVASGRVVGMVAWAATEAHTRIAWMIPLDTIARCWTPLRSLLPTPLDCDPRYARARRQLAAGRYGTALDGFITLADAYPREAGVYYYWAMAGLAGVRPARHSAETIAGVQRLLRCALFLDPGAAHAAALLAIVQEDYYVHRGLDEGEPRISELLAGVAAVEAGCGCEILRHVPAPECHTWRLLRDRVAR